MKNSCEFFTLFFSSLPFRCGLWVTYLLPLALTASCIGQDVPKDHLIITLLALVTSAYSTVLALESFPSREALLSKEIFQEKVKFRPSKWKYIAYVSLALYLLFFWIVGTDIFTFLFTMGSLMMFIYLLPRMWTNFKYSFSYGEGVLVLQSGILYCVNSLLNIIEDSHDPSTVSGTFSIVAMIGMSSLLFLCVLSLFIPKINSPTLFYLIGKYNTAVYITEFYFIVFSQIFRQINLVLKNFALI